MHRSHVSFTAGVILLVLGITAMSIIAVAFQGTIMMLIAISVLSVITGFVTAMGLILRLRLDSMANWKLLEHALNKARESDQVIHATIINQTVLRNGNNGAKRYTLQIGKSPGARDDGEEEFDLPDYI